MRKSEFVAHIGVLLQTSEYVGTPECPIVLHMGIRVWGFYEKKWKNDMRALCFKESGRFFDKIWTWELFVFRERTFLTKYGHKSSDFFVRNRKKRASYWLFWPIIECSCDRINIFLPIMCMTAGSFSWKIWKKEHESTVFWEKISQILRKILKILKVSVKSQRVW